jgi:hypothetical protein
MVQTGTARAPGELGASLVRRLRIARRFVTSLYRSRRERALFRDVRTYCMFVGYARSGHSVVGALLDAHPEAIVADEVDVLQYVAAGFSHEQIFHLLLARSRRQAGKGRVKGGRDGKTYSYDVPGQWQGRFTQLRVIGDSTAGRSTQRIAERPELMSRLQATMSGMQVKLIHVFRNPFDTIATMNLRSGRPLQDGIERYFANCATIEALERRLPRDAVFNLRQEALIEQPDAVLPQLCRFLGLEPHEAYVRACADILYRSPSKSRERVAWPPSLIRMASERIDTFAVLRGYSFDV